MTTTGRTNRWGAMLKAGAVLRASPLDEHRPYAEPRPIERRKVQVGRGEYRTELHDPEDESYTPPSIDPRRRQGRFGAA